jgi:hypothetical protein
MNFKKALKKAIKRYIPKQKIKVSLFVVGAQKSGTSALHNYLIKHSDVIGGIKKELNFFNHSEKYNLGTTWYHKNYQAPLFYKPEKVYIDSTPQYLSTAGVAEKIYAYNPKAKIVILLREPVSRAYSAWNMYFQFSELSGKEKTRLVESHISDKDKNKFLQFIKQNPFPTFNEYVNSELIKGKLNIQYPQIINRGIYAKQIKPYNDLFGFDNVLVFDSNYFKNNKLNVTNTILESVGLTPLKIENEQLKDIHSRKYDTSIDASTKDRLVEFYKPYNEELFSMIRQKMDW